MFFYLTLKLMKLATKSMLRSPNELMVLGDSFLNDDLVDPFNVAKKALHITSSDGPLDPFFLHTLSIRMAV